MNLAIFGATGSVGASTLDVVARHGGRYRVFALTAHASADALLELCQRHRPRYAVLSGVAENPALRSRFAQSGCELLFGAGALDFIASHRETESVMAAIVGAAGLASTLAAVRAGKRVLLANKEAVVMAGALLLAALQRDGGELIPIDSEHNAIFQCLPGRRTGLADAGVRRVLLTASGGPFRGYARAQLATITPEQACAHPNWVMGRKISVDSATLMNKGLEVIEAHWLFGAAPEQIDVVVHRESIVHSLVEYVDGSVLAQLGNPDMRTALAHALAWPERIEAGVPALDLMKIAQLNFEAPDRQTFRCLDLAYQALAAGGTAPTILNAANEIAVGAFLERTLPFLAISELIESTLAAIPSVPADSIETLIHADLTAREAAQRIIRRAFC